MAYLHPLFEFEDFLKLPPNNSFVRLDPQKISIFLVVKPLSHKEKKPFFIEGKKKNTLRFTDLVVRLCVFPFWLIINPISGLRLQYIQKNAMYLLATLFGRADADCSVFDVDAFGLLVSLVVSLPCLFVSRPPRFMSGQGVELHCLKG